MRSLQTKTIFATLFALVALTAGGAVVFLWSGVYNVAASSQHTQLVYSVLEYAMQRSVGLRASHIEAPPLTSPAMFERGAMCYQDRCEQCHAGPGVAAHDVALGMQPVPGPLMNAHMRWKPRELFWITRNGITMSGMPAWSFQLSDGDIWALVAFIERLPYLSPAEYRAIMARHAGQQCGVPGGSIAKPNGDAARGHSALSQYGCIACHKIPGLTGADVHVGPPLGGIARRVLIAGELANTPDNMVRWLRNPKSIDPLTAMPDLGVTERDARDMAAYLATLW